MMMVMEDGGWHDVLEDCSNALCLVLCLLTHVLCCILDLNDPNSFIPYHSRIDP